MSLSDLNLKSPSAAHVLRLNTDNGGNGLCQSAELSSWHIVGAWTYTKALHSFRQAPGLKSLSNY